MKEEELDLFVIGGGSGGVRAARKAAAFGASVAIAEEHRYGGTCVIRGCVPKKLLVYASQFAKAFEDSKGYGWSAEGHFDWATLIANKDQEIDRLNGIYEGMLGNAGVQVLHGRAVLLDKNTIKVGDTTYRAKKILVATGGTPTKLEVPGAEYAITSNEAFHLSSLPKKIVVVGGGYIGLEFAGIFRGLGSEVCLVHHRDQVLRGFDGDVRDSVMGHLKEQGIELAMETSLKSIAKLGDTFVSTLKNGQTVESDCVMIATGRRPHTKDLGLDSAGVEISDDGFIKVDEYSRSNVDSIFALGDCTDRPQLTPVAIRDAQAFADTNYGKLDVAIDHKALPSAVFCQPPIGTVGPSEREAREKGEVDIYKSHFRPMFHTLSGRDEKVLMKLIVDAKDQRVLSFHMVGKDAPEIAQAVAVCIRMGATKEDFDRTIALHPTTAEELVLMRTKED